MKTINPWINFNGNTEEAFGFYKSVFGGEFAKVVRFKDLAGVGAHMSEGEDEKILMISLPVGNGTQLMGNDVPESMGSTNEHENRSKIYIEAESKEEADRICAELSQGGEIEFPMGDAPWGSYYGSLRDKYGIEWMISFDQG